MAPSGRRLNYLSLSVTEEHLGTYGNAVICIWQSQSSVFFPGDLDVMFVPQWMTKFHN